MYCYCYLMKAANTPVTNRSHADCGELGSTVRADDFFRRPPMLIYQLLFHCAHHSDRCDAIQQHLKHDEEDGRWLRMKKRDDWDRC